MKILKGIGIILAVIIAILAIVPVFLSSNYSVSRDITINTSAEKAYNYLLSIQGSKDWSPWDEIDPNIKYSFEGTDKEIGSKLSWESENKNVGKGSMTLMNAEPNKMIELEIAMPEYASTSKSVYTIEEVAEGVKVTWTDSGQLNGYMMRWMGLFMDNMLGEMFETGLSNLKTKLEAMPASVMSNINRGYVSAQKVISIRETITQSQISAKLGELYGQLVAYAMATGVQQVNAPLCIYHHFSDESVEMEPAIPVNNLPPSKDNINAYEMPQRDVVSGTFSGAYDNLGAAHAEMNAWIKAKGYTINGSPWEHYITDPGMVKDTSAWKTVIYYPVQ
jgi:effector-binding domain-containing protein